MPQHARKRIAVRAPEYFPSLGYLALMLSVDILVLADTYQYSRQSFQNRTRIRIPDGWQWLSIPLENGQSGSAIADIRVDTGKNWRGRHRRSLYYNYSSSAMFEYFEPHLDAVLSLNSERLGDFTFASVVFLRDLFELNCRIIRASQLEGVPSEPDAVRAHFESEEYVALPDTARHDRPWHPDLRVLTFEEPTYRQNFRGFEAGMSGLDLLFNYGPEGLPLLRQGIRP